jgi:hypothetical protein
LSLRLVFNLPSEFDQRFIFVGAAGFEEGVRANGPDELNLSRNPMPTLNAGRVISGQNLYELKFELVLNKSNFRELDWLMLSARQNN